MCIEVGMSPLGTVVTTLSVLLLRSSVPNTPEDPTPLRASSQPQQVAAPSAAAGRVAKNQPAAAIAPKQANPSQFELPWVAEAKSGPLAQATELRRGRFVYLLPKGCSERADYDVVLHFHGAPKHVKKAFQQSSLNAVVVIANLGQFSGPYEKAFAGVDSFPNYLERVSKVVAKHCGKAKRRRVAVSSWSGGYGAAYRILARPANDKLVDAFLFSDGLHAALENKFLPRVVSEKHLAPFARFAEQAAAGDKLMAMAHSSIVPPRYASSAETATALLAANGVERQIVDEAGPRDSMRVTSTGRRGGLTAIGFAGRDTDAHCDHLYALGQTLLPQLAARWAK